MPYRCTDEENEAAESQVWTPFLLSIPIPRAMPRNTGTEAASPSRCPVCDCACGKVSSCAGAAKSWSWSLPGSPAASGEGHGVGAVVGPGAAPKSRLLGADEVHIVCTCTEKTVEEAGGGFSARKAKRDPSRKSRTGRWGEGVG
jgi:hypothetical protein